MRLLWAKEGRPLKWPFSCRRGNSPRQLTIAWRGGFGQSGHHAKNQTYEGACHAELDIGPVDHRSEIWRAYARQQVLVEAPDEREARKQVAGTVPDARPPNPWLDAGFTSCDRIDAPDELAPASEDVAQ